MWQLGVISLCIILYISAYLTIYYNMLCGGIMPPPNTILHVGCFVDREDCMDFDPEFAVYQDMDPRYIQVEFWRYRWSIRLSHYNNKAWPLQTSSDCWDQFGRLRLKIHTGTIQPRLIFSYFNPSFWCASGYSRRLIYGGGGWAEWGVGELFPTSHLLC